ncbi:MAG: hypothetical protein R3C05_20185 [Pirellulaceae bacterium]
MSVWSVNATAIAPCSALESLWVSREEAFRTNWALTEHRSGQAAEDRCTHGGTVPRVENTLTRWGLALSHNLSPRPRRRFSRHPPVKPVSTNAVVWQTTREISNVVTCVNQRLSVMEVCSVSSDIIPRRKKNRYRSGEPSSFEARFGDTPS